MKIKDRDQLNAAMGELPQLSSQAAGIDAECDAVIKTAKDKAAAEKVIKVDDKTVSIDERAKELCKAIELYCENNRKDLLAEGEKSVRLTHGVIGWRKSKDYVEPLNKKPEKWWLQKIIEATIDNIIKAINKFKPSDIVTSDVVKVELKWDKAAMLKGVADGRMKPNDLKPFGFAFREGDDEFFFTIDEATIEAKKPA